MIEQETPESQADMDVVVVGAGAAGVEHRLTAGQRKYALSRSKDTPMLSTPLADRVRSTASHPLAEKWRGS